jgi:hypothetical protein
MKTSLISYCRGAQQQSRGKSCTAVASMRLELHDGTEARVAAATPGPSITTPPMMGLYPTCLYSLPTVLLVSLYGSLYDDVVF